MCICVLSSGTLPQDLKIYGQTVRFDSTNKTAPFAIFEIEDPNYTGSGGIVVDAASIAEHRILCKKTELLGCCFDIAVCRQAAGPRGPRDYRLQTMQCIGHRGCGTNKLRKPGSPPENTIDSFAEARRRGAHMVELDVHLTTDGILVVYHNNQLGQRLIRDMTLEEFATAVGSSSAESTRLPTTLTKIIESLPGDIGINIEVKNPTKAIFLATTDDYLARLVEATLELTRRHEDRMFMYSSFSPIVCMYVKMLEPRSKICFLVSKDAYALYGQTELPVQLRAWADYCKIDGFVFSTEFYDENADWARELISSGKAVFCYGDGTNTAANIRCMLEDGVTGLITDNIDQLIALLANKNDA